MSIFASRTQKTIPIPFDEPHTVTIQKLAGRHLEKASQAFITELMQGVQQRGGAVVQKDMQALFTTDAKTIEEQVKKVRDNPLNGLDRYTLIRFGVKAWTYDVPVTTDALDDLDEEAVEFFAREVLRLTKPSLFLTEDEQKAEQKKVDGAPSIA